jgi:hypothetical protein
MPPWRSGALPPQPALTLQTAFVMRRMIDPVFDFSPHSSPAFIVHPARNPDPAPLAARKKTVSPRCNPGRYPSVFFLAAGAGFPA